MKNQNPNVGVAIDMTIKPISKDPLNIAMKPAMKAKMVPTKTSAIISIVVTHADLPAGTPLLVRNAILTSSPPM